MIDKLDVRIPRKTPFTLEFQEAYQHAASKGLLKPSQYYARTGDFRPYGYDVRLHMFASFGRSRNGKGSHDHKLELYDTGAMKFDEMLAEISRVYVCDPLELEMLRRDVCVDVVGTSVNWFKTHTRVEYKRNSREIGYMFLITRESETFNLGVKPNQFRFYNKAAERLYRYRYMLREAEKQGMAIGSFVDVFGHSESAIITRVERQYGGSQCGGKLRSLLKMDRTNPFEPLKFLNASRHEISPYGMDSTMYWAAQHLQGMVQEQGLQYVRAHMSNLVGSKNIKKTWDRYSPHLISGNREAGIDANLLYELYLKSIMEQMGFVG